MKKISLALFLALSLPAFAGEMEIAWVATDFDKDGKKDDVIILNSGTEAEPDLLELIVNFGNGKSLSNPTILRKVGLQSEAGVTMKLLANGSVRIRSTKDWGTSIWSQDLFLSFRNGELKVSGMDMTWWYREKGGKCEFNFLTGKSKVNNKSVSYSVRDVEFGPGVNLDKYVSDCVGMTDLKN